MTILKYKNITPQIAKDVFLAPGSHVIGDVHLCAGSSVWFNTILRGDVNYIRVGKNTNIQDLSLVHVDSGGHETLIGDDVTIGHKAIIHGAKIGNRCLIGMGAILMDGVEIGEDCLIAAGTLVPEGKIIPSGSLVRGLPGKIVRPVTDAERAWFKKSAQNYYQLAQSYFKSS